MIFNLQNPEWETLSFKDIFDGSSSEYDGTFITNGHLVCVSVESVPIGDCVLSPNNRFRPPKLAIFVGLNHDSGSPCFLVIDPYIGGISGIDTTGDPVMGTAYITFNATWLLG